jgi:hypothetical protein
MSVTDALAWYEQAALGRVTIPSGNTPVEIALQPFGVEPALGRFCVGERIPFSAQWHWFPRVHRLVPMNNLSDPVQRLAGSAEAREWLTHHACFDPFECEEWLGSISILAPDPLHAVVGQFIGERKPDGPERIVLQAQRRRFEGYPMVDADALQFVTLQRRSTGWTEVMPVSLDCDGFVSVDYPEPVSEMGYAIVCPKRGLLRMVPPEFWIGEVGFKIGLVNAVLNVEVPAGGRRKPASSYTTNRIMEGETSHVGKRLPPSGAIRIAELQEVRRKRIQIETAPQRLFGSYDGDKQELTEEKLTAMRAEAEAYVAELVSTAQRRVIFVDPDFGLRELQNYALRVMRDGVDVIVLTGIRRMRFAPQPLHNSSDGIVNFEGEEKLPVAHGVHMLKQLQKINEKLGNNAPKVFVMPGSNKPLFHDRFLVVDDIVWAFGPSFNELGERIGLISRVHEPKAVITAIIRALQQSPSLADWMAQSESQDQKASELDAQDI